MPYTVAPSLFLAYYGGEDGVNLRPINSRVNGHWGESDCHLPCATPPSYMKHGLCGRPEYKNLDFVDEPGRAERRVCLACPVRGECLAYAVENKVKVGMWGGVRMSNKPTKVKEAA